MELSPPTRRSTDSATTSSSSFGALLGGIVTLVGTSPNIIVSRMREESGPAVRMFNFTPVGAGVAVSRRGVFLVFGWRLLPRGRKGGASMGAAFNIEGYTTEAEVPEGFANRRQDRERAGRSRRGRGRGDHADSRPDRRYDPTGNMVLKAGDIVILQGEPAALERVVGAGEAEARARRQGPAIECAGRRDRGHGSGDHAGIRAGRSHAGAGQLFEPLGVISSP